MRRVFWMAIWMGTVTCGARPARSEDILLGVRDAPPPGIVVARVDLTAAVGRLRWEPVVPSALRAATLDGRELPFQFAPAPGFHGRRNAAGVAVVQLPERSPGNVWLRLRHGSREPPAAWKGTVRTKSYVAVHDAQVLGGLPSRIEFPATGKVFHSFHWNDRVYHRGRGGFLLRHDPQPSVEILSTGPLCTVVRVRARYMQPGGRQPDSRPQAVYDWYYFRRSPLVLVSAAIRQEEPLDWSEIHFLELNFPGDDFLSWAGGEPMRQGKFEAKGKSFGFSPWGALTDGRNAIAVVRGGRALLHDGRGGYGTYLHARGDAAWRGWRGERRESRAWLWIGSASKPAEEIRELAGKVPAVGRAVVSLARVRKRIEAARGDAVRGSGAEAPEARWRAALAERFEAEGKFQEAVHALEGRTLESWTTLRAGDLRLGFERVAGGVRLQSLFDAEIGREWLASGSLPLFNLRLRRANTKEEANLDAESGWQAADVERTNSGLDIRWREPRNEAWRGISVSASARVHDAASAIFWTLRAENSNDEWGLLRVTFPQVATSDPGEAGSVLFPRGPGEVQRDLWRREFRYQGLYPGGWTAMQFLAAYGGKREGGLYLAAHDPLASTKDVRVASRPESRAVVLAFDHPVPDMGKAGNSFRLPGEAAWRIFRGDWFDATSIYRDWVRREARWYPELGQDGRSDTPLWMRELCVWALTGGAPGSCVADVKELAGFMGIPAGFHWYNWHRIPFDNDYPHYFPTKEGFKAGVQELQQAKVYVMPYINGRLWDTRDREDKDFEFTRVARVAATKNEDGEPYTESYGSKEKDGSPVRLAAMCPTTKLWQEKVRGIVLRLFDEYGLDAVYIDQIAAASPRLCFDAAHGHPLGGGHWWVEGYGKLLAAVRQAMTEGRMLTSECNAEPYMRWLDGYLTWHWQHDGQVPAFPAVYGGAIQMFGRAYRGGPTKNLALRMKSGQQLVFGEQIGWIHPSVVREKENAAFLRQVVRLRWRLRRYFYAGEMQRPPHLAGDLPKVRADWQWSGEWWVSTDAVLTGAWRLPREEKLLLLFVNVGDEAISRGFRFKGKDYGLIREPLRVTRVTAEGFAESFTAPQSFERSLSFPARQAWGWELEADER